MYTISTARTGPAQLEHEDALPQPTPKGNGGVHGVILFAVTEFLGTGSHVPLLLVIDAI
jgi:hypothetical protein